MSAKASSDSSTVRARRARMPALPAATAAGEARVVGGERRPRDDASDHEVDALAEGHSAVALRDPERVQVRLVEHPPGQVDDRREDGPGGELLHVAADEAARAQATQWGP